MGRLLAILILPMVLVSCASVERNPLPESDYQSAVVLGGENVRMWGDDHRRDWIGSFEEDIRKGKYTGVMHREHHYLLVSGGGDNGAYGAGILTGWTGLQSRPEFTMVTGISTGALTAPFAFLGQEYDETLSQLYTSTNTDQIYSKRNFLSIFSSDAMADTTPLVRMIESYMDEALIRAIAAEGLKGRRLYIGTTNLDAGRPVIWDVTAMAMSEHPDAHHLIRQVILASAAIPGAFPPVYIDVTTADGRTYDEMHVDGGTSSQFFFYPSDLNWGEVLERLDVRGTPRIHIIRNGRLFPEYQAVDPRTLSVLGRSVSSLITSQSHGNFFRIWSLAERDGLEVNVAFIPADAGLPESSEAFDPVYMSALFDLGRQKALANEAFLNIESLISDQ